MTTEPQPDARAVCEHFYASHCYRGMSVRLCMTCHEPDWDDLAGQLKGTPHEPAGEPLTAAQCDRLRQMAGEWGDALSAVREALDFAAAKAWTGEQGAVVARAREALKVLSGEEGADHG